MTKAAKFLFFSFICVVASDNLEWKQALERVKDASKVDGKPIMMFLSKKGCPACKEVKELFSLRSVVEETRFFHILNLEAPNLPTGEEYADDGNYVPRILFLTSEGRVIPHKAKKEHSRGFDHFYPTEDALVEGMRDVRGPLRVQELNDNALEVFYGYDRPLYLLLQNEENSYLKELKSVARNHPEALFAWKIVKKKAEIQAWGATGNVLPCVVRLNFSNPIGRVRDRTLTLEPTDLTVSSFHSFVQDCQSGKISYHRKSEAVAGVLGDLTAEAFHRLIEGDEQSSAVVLFYSPYDPSYADIRKEWDQVSNMESKKVVAIAAINAVANDVSAGVEIDRLPMVVFYQFWSKKSFIFEGNFDQELLMQWIERYLDSSARDLIVVNHAGRRVFLSLEEEDVLIPFDYGPRKQHFVLESFVGDLWHVSFKRSEQPFAHYRVTEELGQTWEIDDDPDGSEPSATERWFGKDDL